MSSTAERLSTENTRDAQWRQIPEFPKYWLSDDGRVINLKSALRTGKLVSVVRNRGTFQVVMYDVGTEPGKTRSLEKLMKQIWPDAEISLFEDQYNLPRRLNGERRY